MKKQVFIWVLLFSLILTGCQMEKEKADYSQYTFADVAWQRDSGHDLETLRFYANGEFMYFCSCGSPVDNSDVYDHYTYDPKTETITLLGCDGEDPVELTILECTEEKLVLDFGWEVRTFTPE